MRIPVTPLRHCLQTGLPFVDACMRELAATGWMSNRGRQNVANLLTKVGRPLYCLMPWDAGGAVFCGGRAMRMLPSCVVLLRPRPQLNQPQQLQRPVVEYFSRFPVRSRRCCWTGGSERSCLPAC